jgi:hypothetical protein
MKSSVFWSASSICRGRIITLQESIVEAGDKRRNLTLYELHSAILQKMELSSICLSLRGFALLAYISTVLAEWFEMVWGVAPPHGKLNGSRFSGLKEGTEATFQIEICNCSAVTPWVSETVSGKLCYQEILYMQYHWSSLCTSEHQEYSLCTVVKSVLVSD